MALAKAYSINCSKACERLIAFAASKSREDTVEVAQGLAVDAEQSAWKLAERAAAEDPLSLEALIKATLETPTQDSGLLGRVKHLLENSPKA